MTRVVLLTSESRRGFWLSRFLCHLLRRPSSPPPDHSRFAINDDFAGIIEGMPRDRTWKDVRNTNDEK